MRPSILRSVLQEIGGRRANVTLRNGHHHVDVLCSFDQRSGRVVMTATYDKETTILVYVDCEDIVTIQPRKANDKIAKG